MTRVRPATITDMTTDKLFPCRDCGKQVAWRTSKAGNRYLAAPKHWIGEEKFTERTYWPAHRCTPDPTWRDRAAAAETQRIADAIASGRIERGCTVTVVKGRKVAHGTSGVVFWVAADEDAYGVIKCGFTTADGDKVFINIANLELAC